MSADWIVGLHFEVQSVAQAHTEDTRAETICLEQFGDVGHFLLAFSMAADDTSVGLPQQVATESAPRAI